MGYFQFLQFRFIEGCELIEWYLSLAQSDMILQPNLCEGWRHCLRIFRAFLSRFLRVEGNRIPKAKR